MPSSNTAAIRNIAIVGHGGVGKTTLVEHLLHAAGATSRTGAIEDGSTVCDFEPEEKEHQHSLSSAVVQFDHNDCHINIIDTPGYPDFLGLAIPVLPAVETVAIVIDATKGVQTVTRRMMAIAEQRSLPRIIIINKIDHADANLQELLSTLKESFGSGLLPINLPAQEGASVLDVLEHAEGDTDLSSVEAAHTAITEQVVEIDDVMMEAYLETGEGPKGDELHRVFEQALRQGALTPICFCAARNDVGVNELLDIITRHCPNPLEGNQRHFKADNDTDDLHIEADTDKPLIAHIFKVATDPFVGKLAYFRIHQGSIKHSSQLFVNDTKKAIRIGHLFNTLGKEHTEVDGLVAGDIGCVAKVEELRLNDLLHDSHELDSARLEPLPMPKPMYGLAISPKSRGDETKLGGGVHKLMEEDPTFIVERVLATNQTVARGLGELHMRIMIEKLKNHFGVEVETEPPRVAYKETISSKAEGHHRHKKQTGGAGQFGEVYLRVEPLPNDHEEGFEFVDDTFGGSIPKQFLPAIEKGVRQVLIHGAVAGYPLTGVRVSVYDGKHHPVDSKEVAFITAGKRAFIDAIQKAKPILMEPYVELEVTAPSSFMGDLTSDIAGKRGRVQGADMLPGEICVVKAIVPLSETLAYSSQLKSMTAGQGAYTMDYSHDEQTPPSVQAEIVAAFKPHDDEA